MAIVNFFLQNHKICIFKRNHPKTEVILFWSACLLFVIGFSNLFSLQGWLVTAGLLLLLFATVFRKQFSISWGFWLLLIIGVAYNLATFLFDEWSYRYFVYFLAGPAIFYLFIKNSKQNQGILNEKYLGFLLLSCGLGFGLSSLFICIESIKYEGLALSQGQPLFSPWNNGPMSRTGISLIFLLPCSMALVPFTLIRDKKQRYLIPSSLLMLLLCTLASSSIGNRAFILAVAFLAILVLLSFVFTQKSKVLKRIFLAILCLVFICIVLLLLGIVPPFLRDIPVFKRFFSGGSTEARLRLYKDFFSHFYMYPFGGLSSSITERYVHNAILDMYTFGGLIPFAGCLIILYLFVVQLSPKAMLRKTSFGHTVLFWTVCGILSIGLFEPVFQANPFLFVFFGSSVGVLDENRTAKLWTRINIR